MKLAFSTLGCPGWTWEEIFATAKDLGLDGIEIRGIGNQMFAPATKPFSEENIEHTKKKLALAGLEISMLTSGACLGLSEGIDEAMAEARSYVDLAEKLRCKYVRVLVSANPYAELADLSLLVEKYGELCDYAQKKSVSPLLETNGVLADSKVMADVMKRVNRPNCGVLWDIHHPFRYFHEPVDVTANNLYQYIQYVHVKDSIQVGDTISYRMMGYGDAPILDALKCLADKQDLFVSLEWVKRWCPDLQEPGIVFSNFENYMRHLFKQLSI